MFSNIGIVLVRKNRWRCLGLFALRCRTNAGKTNTSFSLYSCSYMLLSQCTRTRTFTRYLNPFRTAVLFWGQTTQISSRLSPKRDCGSEGVELESFRKFGFPSLAKNLTNEMAGSDSHKLAKLANPNIQKLANLASVSPSTCRPKRPSST